MNVNAETFVIYSLSHRLTIVCHHYVRVVNKPSEHAQELCISRDVNKMHMVKMGGADLVQSQEAR